MPATTFITREIFLSLSQATTKNNNPPSVQSSETLLICITLPLFGLVVPQLLVTQRVDCILACGPQRRVKSAHAPAD